MKDMIETFLEKVEEVGLEQALVQIPALYQGRQLQMNPLLLAALLERQQFDAAVEGGVIETEVRDPVALGVQLSSTLVLTDKEKPPEVLALTPIERREMAWKAISTTQGRKSAVPVITGILVHELLERGYEVSLGTAPVDDAVEVVWVMNLEGEKATQSRFAFIDVASRVLLAKILRLDLGNKLWLQVSAINAVEYRRVGFKAKVWKGND